MVLVGMRPRITAIRSLRHETRSQHDAVDTELLDLLGYLDALGNLYAALETVLHVVLYQYGRSGLRGSLHNLLEAHVHETHAVGKRAAVLIMAMVGVGRQELRDEISVTGMYLDAVETRLVSRIHRPSEILGERDALAAAHAAHEGRGIEVETGRRTNGEATGCRPVRHVATVTYLYAGSSTFGVYGVGDVLQTGYDLGTQPQLFVERQAAAVDGSIGQRGHTHPAAGNAHMVVLELLRGAEILAHGFECGRTYGAVAQRHMAEAIGSEKFRLLEVFLHNFNI